MARTGETETATKIIDTVLSLLDSDGYDAVQLRPVAKQAHVSLATVYKLYPTRDELILAAVEQWMATNIYTELAPPCENESLADGLLRLVRYVFEPWERNPRMLTAYYRARSGPGGQRLDTQGFDAVLPAATVLFTGIDPDYIADVGLVLSNMVYALVGRFANEDLAITEILPALERTIARLTGNNEPFAAAAGSPAPDAPPFTWSPSIVSPYSPGPDGAEQPS
ncbi:TetR family transcriptional regulator [Nocardia amikacinitolerans]|uniref:TetR family transcriptional regulator n=1 Tax=Nocardia amikacinitolerans TaxID=756689 RepID=UPI0020A2CC98|nr:TetR family transcriptional regulator [Nocardia amikacinitolerans]MCP2276140.1 transcriptional regulator, TetR family [Nocardia amikacinitolerans]MCP2294411.1 transcriptional regulator, TetR family [Nocardia amikacinitolerans]